MEGGEDVIGAAQRRYGQVAVVVRRMGRGWGAQLHSRAPLRQA